MTLEEVARTIGYKISTFQNHFKRTQDNLKKKGIMLTRWGEKGNYDYEIEYMEKDEDGNFIEE